MKKNCLDLCVFLFLLLIFASCSSIQKDVMIDTIEASQFSAEIQILEQRIAGVDAAQILGDTPREKIVALCNEIFSDIDKILQRGNSEKNVLARLYALKGRCALIAEDEFSAENYLQKSQAEYKGDVQSLILKKRLKNEEIDSSKLHKNEVALVTLENALDFYGEQNYLEAIAKFDEAFISLAPFYQQEYEDVRQVAWNLRNVANAESDSNTIQLMKKNQISVGEMLLIAQEQTDLLFLYNAGKTLSEAELYRRISTGKLLGAKDETPKRADVAQRIIAARFLWNIFNQRKGTDAKKYSAMFAHASSSPIPDVDLTNPDFDAALGCVENEFMSLVDGINFAPATPISAVEFSTSIKKLK